MNTTPQLLNIESVIDSNASILNAALSRVHAHWNDRVSTAIEAKHINTILRTVNSTNSEIKNRIMGVCQCFDNLNALVAMPTA